MKLSIGMRVILLLVCVSLVGCDAFVRKFTRKPKHKEVSRDEMVMAPEEYKGPQMSKDDLYHQYFLYWKSWQDELIEALVRDGNHKKQVGCSTEAVKNLVQLRPLLTDEKQKPLDVYISRSQELAEGIRRDAYGTHWLGWRSEAERLRRDIYRDLNYPKIKDTLR